MPLAYLFDEHLRGPLWRAIESHNRRAAERIDAVPVGEVEDLPLGTDDQDLLAWTERENRVLVTSRSACRPDPFGSSGPNRSAGSGRSAHAPAVETGRRVSAGHRGERGASVHWTLRLPLGS